MDDPGASAKRSQRVSWVPFGLHQQHPNNYKDILEAVRHNRDNLGYAYRILRDGCCDGCSLGTTGMHDWTMKDIHLCWVRLQLLRLNTMPAMNWHRLEDVAPLRRMKGKALRKLGRLCVPMVRRRGAPGFRRVTWEEAVALIAERIRATDPHRIGWYVTARGLTNEAYYAHQKVARFIGTNHVDTSARVCHAPSTAALKETVGCSATTCSYTDWIGSDLWIFVGTSPANNQPVTLKYLYYAKKAGTKIFAVNPFVEPGMERYWIPSVAESALFGTKLADDFFHIHVGGDIPFFCGVLKHLVENNWTDHGFIAARTAGWEALETKVRALSWESLERGAVRHAGILGLSAALVERPGGRPHDPGCRTGRVRRSLAERRQFPGDTAGTGPRAPGAEPYRSADPSGHRRQLHHARGSGRPGGPAAVAHALRATRGRHRDEQRAPDHL